jgi:hypothetical protein
MNSRRSFDQLVCAAGQRQWDCDAKPVRGFDAGAQSLTGKVHHVSTATPPIHSTDGTSHSRFLLYTTPPRFAGALVHSRFHQGWDMVRDDDVYVSPMISKQAHG